MILIINNTLIIVLTVTTNLTDFQNWIPAATTSMFTKQKKETLFFQNNSFARYFITSGYFTILETMFLKASKEYLSFTGSSFTTILIEQFLSTNQFGWLSIKLICLSVTSPPTQQTQCIPKSK